MDRLRFLQQVTTTAPAVESLSTAARAFQPALQTDIAGHTFLCEFELDSAAWKIYEDLRFRDGVITFVPSRAPARVMPKWLERRTNCR